MGNRNENVDVHCDNNDEISLKIGNKNVSVHCRTSISKKKSYTLYWNILVLILIIIMGYLYYYTNQIRTQEGYFTSDVWIYWNNLIYVIFFGLISGFVIALIVSKTSLKNS